MNKTAIKNFAVEARRKLKKDIADKAGLLGVSEKGIARPLPQSSQDLQFFDIGMKEPVCVKGQEIKQRDALIKAIQEKECASDYKTAFEAIVEEVAYTWFNRLIAIRLMEVSDYLPSRIRVLSSEISGKSEPDMVTAPFDTDLEFTDAEREKIMELKEDAGSDTSDALFRMLFIKQCNKLHEILPELFEETLDYTELLLNISFTDPDGVVYHLVNDIPEEDFDVSSRGEKGETAGQVEIIGWLYQYYISEKHEEVVDPIHGKIIKKEDIPAATQLFTTDWVVRYMVDNSLGRYWIERHPESKLAEKLAFFVTPKDGQIKHIEDAIKPENLRFLDSCVGSGHILTYAFEALMNIYEECGYTERDAASMIVENNLYGLDIDDRAAQLAYFAVMIKGRQHDRRFFTRNIHPHVYAIEESNDINCEQLKYFGADLSDMEKNMATMQMTELLDTFTDAKEYGSIINVGQYDWDLLRRFTESARAAAQISFDSINIAETQNKIRHLLEIAETMARKYQVAVTNPPYMNKLDVKLKEFVKENYKDYSGDLFSVFMRRNFDFCTENGYSAFMTPNVWMFIKTYENLRKYIIDEKNITSLVQMAKGAFFKEATVDICAFVLSNAHREDKGLYIRLEDFKGDMEVQRQKVLEAIADKDCGYFYEADQRNFAKIPGSPVAYWASEAMLELFTGEKIKDYGFAGIGMRTGNNERFLRRWYEAAINNIAFTCNNRNEQIASHSRWVPYNKGGEYRKWYGNNEYIVNWFNDGEAIKENTKKLYPQLGDNLGWKISNENYYYKKGITWSGVTSGAFSCRCYEIGFIFDSGANGLFAYNEEDRLYLAGLLNTKIANDFLKIINPTINTGSGTLNQVPVLMNHGRRKEIICCVEDTVKLSRMDWDSYETSWDFNRNPMLAKGKLADAYTAWKADCESRFLQLKANEEELNRIFIDIYGLADELTPEVADKDITVHRVFDSKDDIPESMKGSNYVRTMRDEIVSLLSYAVGCMFGRYSLDVDGLAYAGGDWDDSKYRTFIPDADNCIPITDEAYLEDDIVGRLVEFVRVVYGDDTLEENLAFIASALGNKGNSSREVIRSYFLNDFIKDHIKTYQKRPIYWQFDSGKKNGFKALVYMHRWNADTVGNLRVEYLHRMQRIYEQEIRRMQETIDNGGDSREISKAAKRMDKLQKQLKETKDYDVMLAHIALSRIDIDLDDGVKVNYEKVQTGRDGKKMQILVKI